MKQHFLAPWYSLGVCLLGALFCSPAPHVANAQPANAQRATAQPVKTPKDYLNDLKSPSLDRRGEAYRGLANFDDRLDMAVLTVLGELKKNPDRSFGGSFEMTLRVVSAMNIREALNSVGDMLDFQLDPATMPHGGFGASQDYYPVAQTVIDLNDSQKTIDIVIDRFDREANDTTLRVYTYVLQQVLGKKIAKFVVQNNLDRAKAQLALMPNAILIEISKTNLEAALKLLDSEGVLIKQPVVEAETGKGNENPVGANNAPLDPTAPAP